MDKLLLSQFLPPEVKPIANRIFQYVTRSAIEHGVGAVEDHTLAICAEKPTVDGDAGPLEPGLNNLKGDNRT